MNTKAPEVRIGYLLQALAIPLWWTAMALSPWVYSRFEYPGTSQSDLFAFIVPDILIISGFSIWCWRRPSPMAGGIVLGAYGYGALWCLARSLSSGGGWLGTVIMILATAFNAFLVAGELGFRRASSSDRPGWNVAKTALQSLFVWLCTLVLIPAAILHSSGHWPPIVPTGFPLWGGGSLFLVSSIVNIWCGWTMARRGGGTPLPLDSTTQLVVTGPYRYVRNPMAMAGLSQGMGVAWMFQSWEIGAYVLLGGLLWNYFVRPQEERLLLRDFGSAYEEYRKQIRCWMVGPGYRETGSEPTGK